MQSSEVILYMRQSRYICTYICPDSVSRRLGNSLMTFLLSYVLTFHV